MDPSQGVSRPRGIRRKRVNWQRPFDTSRHLETSGARRPWRRKNQTGTIWTQGAAHVEEKSRAGEDPKIETG
jgi:hypothetical protein